MPAPKKDTIYYDGACSMCQRSVRVIRALDWLGRLETRDMTEAQRAGALPVAWEQAMQGMPMRTRDGRALVGFPALRRALRQTPLGALPALLLHLPALRSLGAHVYSAIARRRRRQHVCNLARDGGESSGAADGCT